MYYSLCPDTSLASLVGKRWRMAIGNGDSALHAHRWFDMPALVLRYFVPGTSVLIQQLLIVK